jgi:DNA-binding CsgD family transcriptional regulator
LPLAVGASRQKSEFMSFGIDPVDGSHEARDRALDRRTAATLAGFFAVVALLAAVDLVEDLQHGVGSFHAIAEGVTTAIGLCGATWMLRRFLATVREASRLAGLAETLEANLEATRTTLAAAKLEGENWRREVEHLVDGLGAAIDRQLERWGLSEAEQEVALLLLKGLSHRTIADIRGTEEATVRQQSRAIYRKAGLSGRHDLAAFFLEDLLGPRQPAAVRRVQMGGAD